MASLHNTSMRNLRSSLSSWRLFVYRIGGDPYVDWPIIFTIATLAALFLIGVSILRYIPANEVQVTNPTPANLSVIFDNKKLDQVMGLYDSRAAEHSALSHGYSGVGDPSI